MRGLRKGWRELITSLLPGVLVTCNQAARSRAGSAPICTRSAWCCLPRHHPQGDRHKGGRGDLQGMAPGALARSYQRAHRPAPRTAPRGRGAAPGSPRHRAGTPSVRPQRKPSWVFMASRHCLKFARPPTINPYRHWHACRIQERRKEAPRLSSPTDTSPCRGAERRLRARTLTYLCLWMPLRCDG